MAEYLIIFSTGKSVIDGEKYFIQPKDKKEYVNSIKAVNKKRYKILYKSHNEKEIKL